jgi:hypothetical protein
MKYLSVITLFFSLNIHGQVTKERVIVFNSYPDLIEVVKTYRNDSLSSVNVIFTSRDARTSTMSQFETFYYGDAKEFYSWLVKLESLLENGLETMKIMNECDVYVRIHGGTKHLDIYKKEDSFYASIDMKGLKLMMSSFYAWCVDNKVNVLD